MFGNRFSSSTHCSRWLHEAEPGRLDPSFSGRFLKVATHPHGLSPRAAKITGAWPDPHYQTVKGALLLSPSLPAIAPSQVRLVE